MFKLFAVIAFVFFALVTQLDKIQQWLYNKAEFVTARAERSWSSRETLAVMSRVVGTTLFGWLKATQHCNCNSSYMKTMNSYVIAILIHFIAFCARSKANNYILRFTLNKSHWKNCRIDNDYGIRFSSFV